MWGPSLLFASSRYNVHYSLSNPRHFSQLGGGGCSSCKILPKTAKMLFLINIRVNILCERKTACKLNGDAKKKNATVAVVR